MNTEINFSAVRSKVIAKSEFTDRRHGAISLEL
jgi:hypothetical protein